MLESEITVRCVQGDRYAYRNVHVSDWNTALAMLDVKRDFAGNAMTPTEL